MGKHLTPTQKRLIETAEKKGTVEVRTVRTQRAGAFASEVMNDYEAKALHELENVGRLRITCRYEWTSTLKNMTTLGVTFVAKLPN